MNLSRLLVERQNHGYPIRVGVIGAGKFGSMFLAQVPTTLGMNVTMVADLDVDRAKAACAHVGWSDERIAATRFVENGMLVATDELVDVLVDATGAPMPAVDHALAAIDAGKHVVMATVEADILAGAALSARAAKAGVVYSMAYGDQPALIAEMIDWARASGFEVAAAGKGTHHRPQFHKTTPDTVWGNFGRTPEEAKAAGMNPKMFCSFVDGTKSSIEMAAVANACDLSVPQDGLLFPPCGVDDLSYILRPESVGGLLERDGIVEVVSSLETDGRPVFRDLRWGVYVVLKATTDYAADCFEQYGLAVDATGRYGAMYRPFHLIGLEIGISVASAALRQEPTGAPRAFRGDAVSVAKRPLKAGEILDGEGGYTVWGKLIPAARSLAERRLPIGFAHDLKLLRDVAEGELLSWGDVDAPPENAAMALRREMADALLDGDLSDPHAG